MSLSSENAMSDEFPSLPPGRYSAPKWILGATAGLTVGLVWGGVCGCFLYDIDEFQKPYFLLYLAAMLASMSLTGLLVGIIRRWNCLACS
jgi:hypothetical protein